MWPFGDTDKNTIDENQSQIISSDNEAAIDRQQAAKSTYTLAQGHYDRGVNRQFCSPDDPTGAKGGYKNGETLFYPQKASPPQRIKGSGCRTGGYTPVQSRPQHFACRHQCW